MRKKYELIRVSGALISWTKKFHMKIWIKRAFFQVFVVEIFLIFLTNTIILNHSNLNLKNHLVIRGLTFWIETLLDGFNTSSSTQNIKNHNILFNFLVKNLFVKERRRTKNIKMKENFCTNPLRISTLLKLLVFSVKEKPDKTILLNRN